MEQIKTIKSRIMAIALFMLVSVSAALAQAQTTKHIVERGETLETIAQKYGVTKDDIVKLNPDAAQFVYVGMELTVPMKAARQESETNDIVANNERYYNNVTSHTNISAHSSIEGEQNKLQFGIIAGYSFNNYTGKDIKDAKNKGGFHAGFDVRYNINDWLFAEGMIGVATKGYKKEELETSGPVWDDEGPNYDITTKTTMTTTNLELPLYIGINYGGFFIKAGHGSFI